MMLDFEVLAHFLHHLVVQIGAIVSNDLFGESVSTNQLLLYESNYHIPCGISIRSCFDSFGEVIYRHKNEAVTIRRLGFDGPNDIYSPHGKGPRGEHNIQRMWRNIDIVRVCLTYMAFPDMSAAIGFHGEPIIAGPKNFSGHSMPIGMCPKETFVDLLNHEVRLFGIYAS